MPRSRRVVRSELHASRALHVLHVLHALHILHVLYVLCVLPNNQVGRKLHASLKQSLTLFFTLWYSQRWQPKTTTWRSAVSAHTAPRAPSAAAKAAMKDAGVTSLGTCTASDIPRTVPQVPSVVTFVSLTELKHRWTTRQERQVWTRPYFKPRPASGAAAKASPENTALVGRDLWAATKAQNFTSFEAAITEAET